MDRTCRPWAPIVDRLESRVEPTVFPEPRAAQPACTLLVHLEAGGADVKREGQLLARTTAGAPRAVRRLRRRRAPRALQVDEALRRRRGTRAARLYAVSPRPLPRRRVERTDILRILR